MKNAVFLILLLLAALWSSKAGAGFISLQSYATSSITPDGVTVNITSSNIGDAPAKDIQAHVIFQGVTTSSERLSKLAPGKAFITSIKIQPTLKLPGSYAVEILIEFHDMNGRLFSGLAHASFVYDEGVHADVFIQPAEIKMAQKAKLTLKVLNRDTVPREVRLRLAVPREFKTDPPETRLKLKADSSRRFSFKLTNLSALVGASYPVLAFLEYEAGGRHHSLVSESMVSIIKDENFFKQNKNIMLELGIFLVLIIVIMEIILYRKNKKEAAA